VGAYLIKPPRERELERSITIAIARFEDTVKLNRLNAELRNRNEELQAMLAQIKTLRGLLPICASCKKIRDDDGYWQQIEVYIRDHSEAEFSHALCPDCSQKLYPEIHKEADEARQAISEALTSLGWANLEDILETVQLSEAIIRNRLQAMMKDGEVKQLNVDGQNYYKLF
jgi:DNA repair exonuclease SbcCD ATPase subunit